MWCISWILILWWYIQPFSSPYDVGIYDYITAFSLVPTLWYRLIWLLFNSQRLDWRLVTSLCIFTKRGFYQLRQHSMSFFPWFHEVLHQYKGALPMPSSQMPWFHHRISIHWNYIVTTVIIATYSNYSNFLQLWYSNDTISKVTFWDVLRTPGHEPCHRSLPGISGDVHRGLPGTTRQAGGSQPVRPAGRRGFNIKWRILDENPLFIVVQ